MKREFQVAGINFELGNFTPRNNPFERGLKYRLYVGNIPTSHVFSTLREGKRYIKENYWVYM